jgi:hypothetical protein
MRGPAGIHAGHVVHVLPDIQVLHHDFDRHCPSHWHGHGGRSESPGPDRDVLEDAEQNAVAQRPGAAVHRVPYMGVLKDDGVATRQT